MKKLISVKDFIEQLTYKLKNLDNDNSILKIGEERFYSSDFHVVTAIDSVGVKQRFLIPKYAEGEIEHHIEYTCPFVEAITHMCLVENRNVMVTFLTTLICSVELATLEVL